MCSEIKRIWTKDSVHLMLTIDIQVEGALRMLSSFQTPDEKASAESRHHNGVGFSKWDARFGSSLVEQIERGMHLTRKQLDAARRMLIKYEGQLAYALDARRELRDIR